MGRGNFRNSSKLSKNEDKMPTKRKAKKVTQEDIENLEKVVARLKKDNKDLRDALRKEINKNKQPRRDHKRKNSSGILKQQLQQALVKISNLEKEESKKKRRRHKKRLPESESDSGLLRSKLLKVQKQLELQKKQNRKNERKVQRAKVKIQELLDKIAKSNANARDLKRALGAARAKYDKLFNRMQKLKKQKKPIPKADQEELKATQSLITELERQLGVVMNEIEQDKEEEEKLRTTVATAELELRQSQDEEKNLQGMVGHLEGYAESGDVENFEHIEDELEKRSAEQKQQELDGLEQKIIELTNDHDEMEAELEMKEEDLKLKDQELSDLEGTNEVLNAQVAALQMQIQMLQNSEELAKLQSENEVAKDRSLQEQIQELRAALAKMTATRNDLSNQNKDLHKEIEELRDRLEMEPRVEKQEQLFQFKLLELKAVHDDDLVKLQIDFEKKMKLELKKKEEDLEREMDRKLSIAVEETRVEFENLPSPRQMNENQALNLELENLKLELENKNFMMEQLQKENEEAKKIRSKNARAIERKS